MYYKGTIEIKKGFSLTNPTMDVQGIFDSLDNEDNLLFKYLEIHFKEPNDKLIHSRWWMIEEGVTEDEFISNNEVLKQFN